MARHPKHRPRRKNVQDSAFLRLPGEIRMHVYYKALFRPTAIDLWPLAYVNNPEDDTSLAPRIAKARGRLANDSRDAAIPTFRRQDDLQFVRKEMATGLLATCKQIFHEASHIFWEENTFRFSGDMEWFGVRRFLGTVGPQALSRIRSLEVFAPLVKANCRHVIPYEINLIDGADEADRIKFYTDVREAKNAPKMHMVKAPREPWCGEFWHMNRGLALQRANYALAYNVEHVCYLLSVAQTSLELRFILPRGFSLKPPAVYRGNGLYIPEQLLEIGPLFTNRMSLVIEAGAYLHTAHVAGVVIETGMDVVCQPGSFLQQDPSANLPEIEVIEPTQWLGPYHKYDYLLGIPALFDESVTCSVAARGGKANNTPGKKTTGRDLWGFGPCRFVRRDAWRCLTCEGVNLPSPRQWNEFDVPYTAEWCHHCGRLTRQKQTWVILRRRAHQET